ncbi:unnamed protein product [Boreogadus saida]
MHEEPLINQPIDRWEAAIFPPEGEAASGETVVIRQTPVTPPQQTPLILGAGLPRARTGLLQVTEAAVLSLYKLTTSCPPNNGRQSWRADRAICHSAVTHCQRYRVLTDRAERTGTPENAGVEPSSITQQ